MIAIREFSIYMFGFYVENLMLSGHYMKKFSHKTLVFLESGVWMPIIDVIDPFWGFFYFDSHKNGI